MADGWSPGLSAGGTDRLSLLTSHCLSPGLSSPLSLLSLPVLLMNCQELNVIHPHASLSEELQEMIDEWSPGLSADGTDRLSLLTSHLSVPRAVLPSVLCPARRVSHKFQRTTL